MIDMAMQYSEGSGSYAMRGWFFDTELGASRGGNE